MNRVATGIPGLDSLIEGGFPNPSSILVTGPSGVGKSIFGLQYLYAGAKQYDEPGFMVKIEGYDTDMQWYAEKLNFDVISLQKLGKLVLSSYDPVDFEKFEMRTLHSEIIVQLNRIIDQIKAKRVVFDAVTSLGLYINDRARFRTLLYYISRALKEKGCTTLFITEKNSKGLTDFEVEPYVMDGVIDMDFVSREDTLIPSLMVRKMVATKFPISKFILSISDEGMRLASSFYE